MKTCSIYDAISFVFFCVFCWINSFSPESPESPHQKPYKYHTDSCRFLLWCYRQTSVGSCVSFMQCPLGSLRWRHNDHAGVSNHQPPGCLLNRLFRRKSKKTSKLRVTGLCAGNSPGTGEFSAQMASYAENVSIWWRHHVAGTVVWLPGCPDSKPSDRHRLDIDLTLSHQIDV